MTTTPLAGLSGLLSTNLGAAGNRFRNPVQLTSPNGHLQSLFPFWSDG
ncbi:MAG: hypothetical protein ACR2MZ_14275 [Candidatus Dormibacter sp.]